MKRSSPMPGATIPDRVLDGFSITSAEFEYSLRKSLRWSPGRLEQKSVHIWMVNLKEDPAPYQALLDAAELARAAKMVNAQEFVIARGALKTILGDYTGSPAASVTIDYLENGKPYLPSHPDIRFNVSHSHGTALVAVTLHNNVGIDIESLQSFAKDEGLLDVVLNTAEKRSLEGLSAEQREREFLQIWTSKEAYLKALGVGLYTWPRTIEISAPNGGPLRIVVAGAEASSSYYLYEIPVASTHLAALSCAAEAEIALVRYTHDSVREQEALAPDSLFTSTGTAKQKKHA